MFKIYLLVFVSSVGICMSAKGGKPKFVIDNDAGGDDAMAIFMALLYEKHFDGPELLALMTVNGNTNEDNVCINNKKVLRVAERQDVPIYRGAKESLVITPNAGEYYGKDGLGDNDDVYTHLIPARNESAVQVLIDLSKKYEGDLSVITIGPVTNVALAIKNDPEFLDRLSHLYIGAGHIHSDLTPKGEFNARHDAEAYHIIMQNSSPDKVTVLPFSQAKIYCNFSKEWRMDVLGAINTDIIKAQNKFERVSLQKQTSWPALDPATVAMFLRPDLVDEYKYSQNDIILSGDRRGINTNNFVDKSEANVRIIYSVKTEDYKQFLIDVFTSNAK